MRLQRFILQILVLATTSAIVSCTDFREEEVPVNFGVDTNQLDFAIASSTRSVTVSSGKKWDVTSKPEWITLQSITRSGSTPYEWTVIFSASANEEYNRDGNILIKSGSDTAEILITQEGKKGRYIAVQSVSLTPTELTLTEGDNATIAYEIQPSNASIKDVTWKSSAPSIATVNQAGRVDAIAEGTALVSITTEDGNKTATCSITVTAKVVAVTGVSLNKTSLTMTEGDTQTLTATVTPSNATDKSVTWSSSNTSVATVSSSGVVTAKSAGSATITVKTNDGNKTTTCSVTVTAKKVAVTGISLNKTSLTMTEGDTQTLTATVTPSSATDKSVTWSSSNTSVATVSSSGVVTAKAIGSATITVTTNDGGKTATCSVTVQAQTVSVTGVSLDKTSVSLCVGETQTLYATVTPSTASDKSVTWSSSNTSVATVSSSGVVTALLVGSATITVTTNDGSKTATCSITVVYPIPVAVDLGLSVKWASFNVGAAKPEDSGYYFPWGVTEPVTFSYGEFFFYTLDSYKWYNSSDKSLTKYCPIANYGHNGYTDNKSVLDSNDDAAYVNLGTMWRVPTNEEFAQLKERCTWKWTSTNGVNGYRVTGPNGNSIFLPAAGFGTMMEFRNGGTQGYYWSTSLRTDYPYYSYSFSFGASSYDNESRDRSNILPIRPVTGEPTVFVTGVSLNKTSLTMTEGDTQTLTATVTPSNATDKSVTWSSSNTSVATVSSSGLVTAKAAGSATITVKTNDGNKTATCAVTVTEKTVSVTGVSLNKTSLSMTEGDTQTLTATVTPSNATDKSVTWSSSNTSVATVSSSGLVTAKAAGSATITVKTNDGNKTATCAVTVTEKTVSVTGVSLNKTSLSMTEGDTQTLTAMVTPSNATDKSVTWSSSNTSVATVSSSGVVTAKAAGSATITVTTNDGSKKATCSVSVSAATVAVTGVSLNKTSLSMTVGDTQTLTATVTPSNATDMSVTWSSSNTSVATVSSSGVVTAKAAGSATITVKTNDGNKTATCSIMVTEKPISVTGVSLNTSSMSLTVGDTQTLVATLSPSNATDKSVTWSSNKTSVATVSTSGVVTAKAAGTATITVTTNDGGLTATCSVAVQAKDNHNYPSNSIHGAFSVSSTKQVCFARANMSKYGSLLSYQYSIHTSSWTGSDATDGLIDIAETDVSEIINSSSELGSSWRILSKDEWTYLLEERKNADKKYYVRLTEMGALGMFLAPDDWVKPDDFNLQPWNLQTGGICDISSDDYAQLEEYGFVFLPRINGVLASPKGGLDYSSFTYKVESGGMGRYALSDPINVSVGTDYYKRKIYSGYRLAIPCQIVSDHYNYQVAANSYGTMFSAVRASYDL